MTTPNQPAPSTLETLLGVGHFEMGGGDTNYGQGIDEDFVTNLVTIPLANLGNMLEVLGQVLLKLPMEALAAFQSLVPDWIDGGETQGSAVDKILGILDPRKIPQYIDDFDQWVADVFNPIANVVPSLTDSMGSVITLIRRIVDAIITGLRGIPIFGTALADALDAIPFPGGIAEGQAVISTALSAVTGSVTEQRVQQQNFTISSFGAAYRNPSWVCRYPIADVSYPEAMNMKLPLAGYTDIVSGHQHQMLPLDSYAAAAENEILKDWARAAIITATNTTVYDTVSATLRYQGSGGGTPVVYIEVFREDAAGGFNRLFVSSDVRSLLIGTTATYVEVALPSAIIAQSGERFMVKVRNAASVTSKVFMQGVRQSAASVDSGALFNVGSTASQTSYTAAEMATGKAADTVVPWAMLAAKNIVEPEVSFSDDFNREFLGPEWVTNGIDIVGGKATYVGTTTGEQTTLRIRRTTRDASMVSGNLYVDATATTQRLGIRLHCDRDAAQSVELSITGTDAKIYSYASGTPTQRATVAVGGTDLYSLYYDQPNDKYVALKDGAEFGLSWTSVGSAITHGQDHRFGGIRIARASSVNAGTIDNWTLTDYSA